MNQRPLSRRSFLRIVAGSAAASGGGTLGTFFYAREIEPAWVEVAPVALRLPRLPGAFDGYRIVQITDLHADGAWMTEARMEDLVRLVNAQKPDLIVVTGDFTSEYPEQFGEGVSRALGGLEAPDGVVGVLGNHDHWSDAATSRQILAASGIRELNDDLLTLRRGDSPLHIAGLDDLWPIAEASVSLTEQRPRLDRLAARFGSDEAAILLVHEPDLADVSAATGRFDAQLSGHSHGGQVRVPFYGPLVLPFLGRKYPAGLYRVGSMLQYTGRGLGVVGPQVRFNCRPELTVFTLSGEA
ncbi:MAG TPA: metallophosphoesterase [Herpetosiphonaceae bacterium]|nr:metallophosphoesterase [Herpetosiphonaceae bacterium]